MKVLTTCGVLALVSNVSLAAPVPAPNPRIHINGQDCLPTFVPKRPAYEDFLDKLRVINGETPQQDIQQGHQTLKREAAPLPAPNPRIVINGPDGLPIVKRPAYED